MLVGINEEIKQTRSMGFAEYVGEGRIENGAKTRPH